jgi:cell division septation protein DedD
MAVSRGRGLRPGGVVRALGRLSLLIGFGFAAGLTIGVLSEEPELLAGHLRGEGEAIVLAPTEGPIAESDAAAGKVLSEQVVEQVAAEREAVMETRPEEVPRENLPVVAARPVTPRADSNQDRFWAIQVGAFADEASAARLADGLVAKGYPTELLAAGGESKRWRVRVQPLSDEEKAKEIAIKLKRVEHLPTWVIPVEGRPHR